VPAGRQGLHGLTQIFRKKRPRRNAGLFLFYDLWKVAVNIFAVVKSNKVNQLVFYLQSYAIIPDSDAVINGIAFHLF